MRSLLSVAPNGRDPSIIMRREAAAGDELNASKLSQQLSLTLAPFSSSLCHRISMWSCSNGRSEEEDQLRRRHKLGDRSEWESEFLNKHGRYSLSPVRDDYKTLDAKCVSYPSNHLDGKSCRFSAAGCTHSFAMTSVVPQPRNPIERVCFVRCWFCDDANDESSQEDGRLWRDR